MAFFFSHRCSPARISPPPPPPPPPIQPDPCVLQVPARRFRPISFIFSRRGGPDDFTIPSKSGLVEPRQGRPVFGLPPGKHRFGKFQGVVEEREGLLRLLHVAAVDRPSSNHRWNKAERSPGVHGGIRPCENLALSLADPGCVQPSRKAARSPRKNTAPGVRYPPYPFPAGSLPSPIRIPFPKNPFSGGRPSGIAVPREVPDALAGSRLPSGIEGVGQ